MADLTRPSVLVAAGLIGGYAAARYSGRRQLGGAVLAAAVALSERRWVRTTGPVVATGLGALTTGLMGVSHPLAKKIGAWPSVLAAAAVSAGAAYLVADRD
jgi:hypothetical protein